MPSLAQPSAGSSAGKPACADRTDTFCSTVWNMTHTGWLAGVGDTIVAPLAKIALIVVVALIVRWLLHRVIRRLTSITERGSIPAILQPLAERPFVGRLAEATGLLAERRRQRAETIGSIMRSVASFVIVMVAFMLVLGELGINLAPIIAGAGIIGVAFGLGAQTIVRDFLAGMFMILEDQYGVGDVVDAGLAVGTIEAVGLRTSQLRDRHGTVWYVRNGEVARVGNFSQGEAQLDIVVDLPPGGPPSATAITDVATVIAGLRRDADWVESILTEPTVTAPDGQNPDHPDAVRIRMLTRRGDLEQVADEARHRVSGSAGDARDA
ncbi:MAG: mechanosensitive ion channel family protein [Mycobacteriales bacterium]